MAQAAAMHGCHIAALNTQLHAAMQQGTQPPAADEQERSGAAEAGAGAAVPGHDEMAGYMRTIAELRAALEDRSRGAAAEAARRGGTPGRGVDPVGRAELERRLEQQRRALEADKAASLQSLKDLFQRCGHRVLEALSRTPTRLHTCRPPRPSL